MDVCLQIIVSSYVVLYTNAIYQMVFLHIAHHFSEPLYEYLRVFIKDPRGQCSFKKIEVVGGDHV